MVDGKNFFDETVKNNLRIYDSIQKHITSQGDDYTTGYLLDYNYFKDYHSIIAKDLIKQQAMQLINSTQIQARERNEDTTMFFIIEEAKGTILDFLQGAMKILWMFSYDAAIAYSTIYFALK